MTEMLQLAGVPSIAALEAEHALRDLVAFVPHLSPKYMKPTHLAPLLRKFELAVEGIPQRVCCSAPPRHAKTESVLHLPAFALRRKPELTLSYSTYADRLSRSKSRKARALAVKAGVRLESSALNEWRTPEGGGLLAGGVGGPLTGHGVNILIVDDPIKNRVEAESGVSRAKLLDWWNDVAATRIEPGGSAFVFMTRWHPDDLIGELLAEKGFEYINLPALDDEGAPLWPERWDKAALEKRREDVGEFTWSSLYQGRPRARGENVFGDCHVWKELPIVYRAAGGVDSAYSMKKTADNSSWVKMVRHGKYFYVTGGWRGRTPAPHFKKRLHLVHKDEPTMTWRWYVASSEMGAAELFADGDDGVPLVGELAKQDKFIRAQRYAAAWNSGRVLVPAKAGPWLDEFLAEHASFTGVNDKRDDFIDAAVAAFDELDGESDTKIKTKPRKLPGREYLRDMDL
ncbi:MAG: hypothetical protein JNM17_04070 [Archangium sp.]|nr:hypothetical protein [Archangium sp.]